MARSGAGRTARSALHARRADTRPIRSTYVPCGRMTDRHGGLRLAGPHGSARERGGAMTPPIEPGGSAPGTVSHGHSTDHARPHRSAEEQRKQATAARELSRDDVGHLSGYVAELADQLRKVSGTLREKSGDELLREVGQLARERPAVFLAGAVAVGFGLGRFARASQRPHGAERDQLPVPAGEARIDASAPATPTSAATAGSATPAASATPSAPSTAPAGGPDTGVAGTTPDTGAATPGTNTGGTGL